MSCGDFGKALNEIDNRNNWLFTGRNKTELRRSEVLALASRYQIVRDNMEND